MSSLTALIANPRAGSASGKKVELAARLLREGGREVTILYTQCGGDGMRLAREAAGMGASLVVAAGGDGTFNEVANGLAGSAVPMALLPAGTTNVLAKEFSIPEDVRGAVSTALNGTPRTVSLGKIEWEGKERYFCFVAGMGFDGATVYATKGKHLMKISGKLSHIVYGIGVLFGWSPPALRVEADGKHYEGYSLIVCNAAKYAGHMKVAPHASMLEPPLYMFLMHGKRRVDILRYAFGILAGTNINFKDVTYGKVDVVRVEGTARIQVDGDYIGKTPAVITADAARIRFVY
jgi:YegS/Rv2252/BmrU family lipid kinase